MDEFTLEQLDFTKRETRKEFVNNTESGFYSGKDLEGKEVIVSLEKGVGMDVKYLNSKGWYEGLSYDHNGTVTDEILEKAQDL